MMHKIPKSVMMRTEKKINNLIKSNLLADYLENSEYTDSNVYSYIRPEIESRLFHGDDSIIVRYRQSGFNLLKTLKKILRKIFLSTKLLIAESNNTIWQLKTKNCVLSTGYFSIDNELKKHGYSVFRAPWVSGIRSKGSILPSHELFVAVLKYEGKLKKTYFFDLLSSNSIAALLDLKNVFYNVFVKHHVSSFICASSYDTYDRMSIDVLKMLGKRSFMYQHGLPGVYENHMKYYDDTYDLMVWGQAFKDKYVSLGMDPNKIHVVGHSWYQNLDFDKLRFDLEDVLIITKAVIGIRVHADDCEGDTSASLLYLHSIRNVLKKCGVQRVRVRPHPSESKEWYRKFLDPDFFVLDNYDLNSSLKRSSLVIGPTSSVFIDATYNGVNYLVYEPNYKEGKDLFGNKIVFPFDGSDQRIFVANSESELIENIQDIKMHDLSFWPDYVHTPFDLKSVINRMSA